MEIREKIEGSSVMFIVEGKLDTTTAPLLEERLGVITDDITEVVFDFAKLQYISSAGLRTLLIAAKKIGENGVVRVENANLMVQDVFRLTGFSQIIELV